MSLHIFKFLNFLQKYADMYTDIFVPLRPYIDSLFFTDLIPRILIFFSVILEIFNLLEILNLTFKSR